jgi:hypothetical protein
MNFPKLFGGFCLFYNHFDFIKANIVYLITLMIKVDISYMTDVNGCNFDKVIKDGNLYNE